jgi:hypothetical protein
MALNASTLSDLSAVLYEVAEELDEVASTVGDITELTDNPEAIHDLTVALDLLALLSRRLRALSQRPQRSGS